MAFIKIRGRLDPLVVDDDRAKKVKERKFGVEGRVEKALPTELVDLGEWSGEYGRIVEIELSTKATEKPDWKAAEREAEQKKLEEWYKLPAAEKAKNLGWFKLCYSSRIGDWKWEPTPEQAAEAVKIQQAFFESHPRTLRVPASEYGDLLPPKSGQTLAQSKRVQHVPEPDELAF